METIETLKKEILSLKKKI